MGGADVKEAGSASPEMMDDHELYAPKGSQVENLYLGIRELCRIVEAETRISKQ